MININYMTPSRGFLTIAYGDSKYITMANALALSIRLHSPNALLAVVTDRINLDVQLFDFIIPVNLDYPSGVAQKLFVDKYTPFEETIFIDSDCLCYKDINNIWDLYENVQGFGIKGWGYLTEEDKSYYAVNDLQKFFEVAGVKKIGLFNSGVFYFDKSPKSYKVFEIARQLFEHRQNLSLKNFKNSLVNDEPIFALSLEKNGIDILPLGNENHVMLTPSGILENQYKINVLTGCSSFKKNGDLVEPFIIHYHVDCSDFFIYWRDVFRLNTKKYSLVIASSFIVDLFAFFYSMWRRKTFYVQRILTKLGVSA